MARTQLGSARQQVERLFTTGTLTGCSDAALLRRYVTNRDEEVFAGLVARHGPMVMSEGMTHLHAASELGCGEATLCRRLAKARERLRARLVGRGLEAEDAVTLLPFVDRSPVPAAWLDATVHAAAAAASGRAATTSGGLLAAAVIKALSRMWLIRTATVLELSMRSVIAVTIGVTLRCERRSAVAPRQSPVATFLRTAGQKSPENGVLKHVLHGYVDEAAAEVLGHCRSVLPANGRVLIIEFLLPDLVDHVDRDLEQRLMSDLNMLVVTGGKERSAAEWKQLLASTGFKCERIIQVPGDLVSIIEAAPAPQ
jgi:O-methyltransferase domain